MVRHIQNRSHFARAVHLGVSSAAVAAAILPIASVRAQESLESEEVQQAIIITGSRIARLGQNAPVPLTVVTADEIKNLGLSNVSDVVAQLPQNSSFTSTTNVGAGNFNIGASLANLRGLNPFYGTRTLTLVDSRRHVPTTNGGAVDLNVIPSMLISRVDTVTGGASAAYGSDAIAGVVNILLDTRFSGVKAQADMGLTGRGDGRDAHVSLAYGTDFGNERLHVVVGLDWQDSEEIGGCSLERGWCADSYGLFTNPDFATNGQPHYIVGKGARSYNSDSGLFPFLNMQFNAAGNAFVPFTPGAYGSAFIFSGAQMQGGADASQDQYRNLTMRPSVERLATLGHVEYEFSASLSAFAELSYSKRSAINRQQGSGASIFFNTIAPDNVYLPTAAAPFFAFGPQPFTSNGQTLPDKENHTEVEVWRGVFGLRGQLSDNWRWDAYYTYGRNDTRQRVNNMKVNSFFAFALDAVDNPATAVRDPVCRATLPGPAFNAAAAGCIPLNLFGTINVTPTALAYSYRTLHQDERYEQHVASLTVQGDLFNGIGAGPVGVAVGGEYRNESLSTTHDLANQPWYFAYELNYGGDFSGRLSAWEAFGELNVPVLQDVPFFQSLSFDGALRKTWNKNENALTGTSRNSDFVTWKASGIWQMNDWLRFRVTRSRDARAPSFYERFSQNSATGGFFGSVNNPWAAGVQQPITATLGGADSTLNPEFADTWTVGSIITAHGALEGAYTSIDWYQVELDGPISTLGSAQNVVNACLSQGTFCNLISGTGPVSPRGYSTITAVAVPYLNLGSYVTRGLDIEAGYRMGIGKQGNLSLRGIASYLYDMIIDYGTGAQVRNNAGVSGPTAAFGYFNTSPKWQGNAFLTYAQGGFTGTIQARYIGPGKFALLNPNTGNPYVAPGDPGYSTTSPDSISSNHVDDAVYFNLNASYRVALSGGTDRSVEFFASVNNVFDRDPPVAPGGNGYPANPVFFDTIGRAFRAGVRLRY